MSSDRTDKKNTSPRGWYFHSGTARKILEADQAGERTISISLDLNLSVREWSIREGHLVLGMDGDEILMGLDLLEPLLSSDNKVFYFDGKDLKPVEVRADGYYKLVPTDTVPTLEINGIKMHRSKDIAPLEDARLKTESLIRPGHNVLDTCGGLGYSALFSVKAGAKKVVSTEKSGSVLKIREFNPWTKSGAFDWLSSEAFCRIELVHGDITRYICDLDDLSFHTVIHDPPRFSSATGDLYGKLFYSHLARVLKPGGKLFHYTGSPQRIKNGNRFVANAIKRLEQAGFARVEFDDHLQGIFAQKA